MRCDVVSEQAICARVVIGLLFPQVKPATLYIYILMLTMGRIRQVTDYCFRTTDTGLSRLLVSGTIGLGCDFPDKSKVEVVAEWNTVEE